MSSLSLREASLKYHIPKSTLRGWVQAGLIHVDHPAPGKGLPMLLSEHDVSKLAQHYQPGSGGRGKVERLREMAGK